MSSDHTKSRWHPIASTTPSGKMQWVCLCCGRVTSAPTKKCDKLAYIGWMRPPMRLECSNWVKCMFLSGVDGSNAE